MENIICWRKTGSTSGNNAILRYDPSSQIGCEIEDIPGIVRHITAKCFGEAFGVSKGFKRDFVGAGQEETSSLLEAVYLELVASCGSLNY